MCVDMNWLADLAMLHKQGFAANGAGQESMKWCCTAYHFNSNVAMYHDMHPSVRMRDIWLKTYFRSVQNNLHVSPGPVC